MTSPVFVLTEVKEANGNNLLVMLLDSGVSVFCFWTLNSLLIRSVLLRFFCFVVKSY